ncbi:MAG: hypothetical protein EON54_11515 [Alcaligenaceae bacterium]|nr:MAG: hypothetical protein EON54_11515 [Alcaligenaceae bacterium]
MLPEPSSLAPESPALSSPTPEPAALASSTRDSPALTGLMPKESAGRAPASTPARVSAEPVSRNHLAVVETTSRAPALPPVRVAVDIRPWGDVYIDGIKRGASPPLRELALSPGTYHVSIRNPHAMVHQYSLTVPTDRTSVAIKHQFPLD